MPWGRFLDPKNDYCFTQIFGTEKNKDILIHFLNDILCYKGDEQVADITFLPTSQEPDIAVYRQSIVDVMCTNQHGEQFIVEMQLSKHKGFEKRAQYYAAKAYSQQVLKEDENHKKMAVYAKLKGVVFLAIANFTMFPDKKNWQSKHYLLDSKTYEHDLKDFHFVFMELDKFKLKLEQLTTIQEKWAYFFKHAQHTTLAEIEHLIGKDIIIKRAFEAIDQASWTEEELRTYEHSTKTYFDNLAVEQQKIEDAEARGEVRGKTEGKAEGKTEEKIEIAKAMLLDGDSPERVAKITGLSTDEIEKLKF